MNNPIENEMIEQIDDLAKAFDELTDIELEARISKESHGKTGNSYC